MSSLVKRKRSDSELSFSSSATLYSPPRGAGKCTTPTYRVGCTPLHLPSRTMKRFRDNRPSDVEVHREFSHADSRHLQHADSAQSIRWACSTRRGATRAC